MFGRGVLLAAVLLMAGSAHAQPRPGPAGTCVNAAYNAIRGTWGPETSDFNPNHIPASAWQIFRQDAEIMLQLTNGDVNMWFLTEHGADFVRQTGRNEYEGVYIATRLLSCQAPENGQPAVVESMISLAPDSRILRERIEAVPGRFTITRFDPNSGEVVSEQRMRAYQPPPAPAPLPRRR